VLLPPESSSATRLGPRAVDDPPVGGREGRCGQDPPATRPIARRNPAHPRRRPPARPGPGDAEPDPLL